VNTYVQTIYAFRPIPLFSNITVTCHRFVSIIVYSYGIDSCIYRYYNIALNTN